MKHILLLLIILACTVPVDALVIERKIVIKSGKVNARNVDKGKHNKQSGYSLPINSISPTPKPVSELQWDDMKLIAVKVARKHDIHPSVLVAVTAIESKRGQSNFCKKRNNCWGINAVDSDPGKAFHFDNYQEGVEYLAKMLCKPNGRYAVACAHRHDPYRMVAEMKKANYATDPDYVRKVTSSKEFTDYIY